MQGWLCPSYTCTHIHMNTDTCTWIHAHTYIFIHIYTPENLYVYTHINILMHKWTHTCIYILMNIHRCHAVDFLVISLRCIIYDQELEQAWHFISIHHRIGQVKGRIIGNGDSKSMPEEDIEL